MTTTFSYEGKFSARSKETAVSHPRHATYDFAVAYPPPETVPFDGLIEGLKKGLEREGHDLVYYTERNGNEALREFTAQKLANDRGVVATPDEIFMTAGSGEANFVLIKALSNPGDTVVTEQFVYGGTLNQLRNHGINVVGSPIDMQGIIPEALDETFTRLTAEGKKPKFFYTIPEHQNPTGTTTPTSRRKQVIDICHRHEIPILEDDCYVDLRFDGEMQEAYASLDTTGMVMHVASYSKLLVPGLRLGYFVAPEAVTNRAVGFRSSGTANHFASLAIEGYLSENLQDHKDNLTASLGAKANAMVASLGENFGGTGAKWAIPQGGCYTWLTMPEDVPISDLVDEAFDAGVGYLPGASFAPNGDGQNSARLCFGYETPEKNRDGIARLAEFLDSKGHMKSA